MAPLPKKMYLEVSLILYKNDIKGVEDFMASRVLPEVL